MNKDKVFLPSNKSFGRFFSIVFLLLAAFSSLKGHSYIFSAAFFLLSTLLLLITIYRDDILYPFNLYWFKLGLIIGKVVSPIVLGFIFYLIFTPISIISYIFGRDELRIRKKNTNSYWIIRKQPEINPTSFTDQF